MTPDIFDGSIDPAALSSLILQQKNDGLQSSVQLFREKDQEYPRTQQLIWQ